MQQGGERHGSRRQVTVLDPVRKERAMWAAAHLTFLSFPLSIQYGVLPRRMVPPQGCVFSVILTSQADNEGQSPYHSSYSSSLERGADVVRVVRGQNIQG